MFFPALLLAGNLVSPFFLYASDNNKDFIDRFYIQKKASDPKGMEKTLREWKAYCPKDIEIPAAQGYLERDRAGCPKKPGPSGQRPLLRYPLRDISFLSQPHNRKALLSAENAWQQALQTQPDRLDLALELSEVEQSLGRFECQYALLAQALQKNDQNPESWRWIPGEEMPASPLSLLSNSLLESEAYYLNQGSGQSSKLSRLARLAMTFHNQDPLPYNALAVSFQYQGNAPFALKYLLLAFKRDSNNCLVLGNIGRLLKSLGKKREAQIYFNRVVSLNKDPDETAEAKGYLKDVKTETNLNREDAKNTERNEN